MRITPNWPHIALWGRLTRFWATYVAAGLIMGWSLGPRVDEVIFVALLPLPFVVIYAVGCLVVAWLRVLMAGVVSAGTPGFDTPGSFRPTAPGLESPAPPGRGDRWF